MDREYERDRHSLYLVQYHLVWCSKRQKPVLIGDVVARLREVLEQVAIENGWRIEDLAVLPDHVHLLIRGKPSLAPHEMVRLLKGRSSRVLRSEFPDLLRLPSLWTRSYFCSTADSIPTGLIRQYIEAQKG